MIKIKLPLICAEQVGERNIRFFCRNQNGKRFTKDITDFYPYFYVDENEFPNIPPEFKKYIIKEEIGYISLFGDKLKKIITTSSGIVPKIRDLYEIKYESYIKYPIRCTINLVDEILQTKLRKCYYDIETGNPKDTFPKPELADYPITIIGNYDNFIGKIVQFTWRKDLEKKTEKRIGHSVYYFNNEIEMINKWIDFIIKTDPDLLIAHNSNHFDIPYLINRCKRLGVNLSKISPMNVVRQEMYKQNFLPSFVCKGRYLFDSMQAYMKMQRLDYNISLKVMARNELGKEFQKIEIEDEDYEKVWLTDLSTLIKRNKMDIEILREVDKKIGMIDYFYNKIRLNFCSWKDTFWDTRMGDRLILKRALIRKQVLPSSKYGQKGKTYKGAFVKEPEPGAYYNVVMLDVKSMYPEIIRTFNISPETKSQEGNIILPNNIRFKSEPKGLIPEVVEFLLNLRRTVYTPRIDEMRKKYGENSSEYKTAKQQDFTVKSNCNAVGYGYLGYRNSRLHDVDCAKSITLMGEYLIKHIIDFVEKLGLKVIYADTDSVFIIVKNENLEKEGYKIRDKINKSFDDWVKQFGCKKHYFRIEFDDGYESLMFVEVTTGDRGSKKKYAGWKVIEKGKKLKEKKFSYKGIKSVKLSTAPVTKEIEISVIKKILAGGTEGNILGYITKMKQEIKKSEDYDYLAFRNVLRRNPEDYAEKGRLPQVKGAIYSKEILGIRLTKGDIVKWLYVKNMPEKFKQTNHISFNDSKKLPKGIKIDWKQQMSVLIDNVVGTLFKSMKWRYIADNSGSMSLSDFK